MPIMLRTLTRAVLGITATLAAVFGYAALLSVAVEAGQPLSGTWEGVARKDALQVNLRLELQGRSGRIEGAFFNGDERVTSTAGHVEGNTLTLDFAHYATRLVATLEDGRLQGTYGSARNGQYALALHRVGKPVAYTPGAPDIAGLWTLPVDSSKGERAFRFIVRQQGSSVQASILRVDGDTGLLTGGYVDGAFRLDHFDGGRAYVLKIVPRPDRRLDLSLQGAIGPDRTFTAIRAEEAAAQGIAAPSDTATHTRWKDPAEPFRFSFPDLSGRTVSNTDPRFAGKVLVINITGTWCPNCHDEAPYLAEIYERYRGLGLEVVALSFEEAEQLADAPRLRAFVAKYGIDYSYLIAGEPSQLKDRIPGADNLNAWPTTFFVGRDGRVRGSHTGFAAPASGEFHAQLRREFAETIERLLAERG